MTEQRILYTEKLVGYGHPTLPDTLNRLSQIEHNPDGTHNAAAIARIGVSAQVATAPYPAAPVATTRALNTVYQNTRGKPIWVCVTSNSSSAATLHGYTDASNPPTTDVIEFTQAAGYAANVGFWVLPNNYYKVVHDAGTPTLTSWVEVY